MPTRFQLFLLINEDALLRFPYVATGVATHRVILVNEESVVIINPEDTVFFESDYLPTSRSIEIDLAEIDRLVGDYIGPFDFNIITRFNEEKHITLTYHSPTNESPKDYDIYVGYPEERARKLVEDIYPVMEMIRQVVLEG